MLSLELERVLKAREDLLIARDNLVLISYNEAAERALLRVNRVLPVLSEVVLAVRKEEGLGE